MQVLLSDERTPLAAHPGGYGDLLFDLQAHYLTSARRDGGKHYDPVLCFHLGNGALVHAVHADADMSDRSQRESCGVITNYLYDLASIEQNHESSVNQKQVIASPQVRTQAQSFQSIEGLQDA